VYTDRLRSSLNGRHIAVQFKPASVLQHESQLCSYKTCPLLHDSNEHRNHMDSFFCSISRAFRLISSGTQLLHACWRRHASKHFVTPGVRVNESIVTDLTNGRLSLDKRFNTADSQVEENQVTINRRPSFQRQPPPRPSKAIRPRPQTKRLFRSPSLARHPQSQSQRPCHCHPHQLQQPTQ
jgi:hypothetical protein